MPGLGDLYYIAPMKSKQQSLFDKEIKRRYSRTQYGGTEGKGHRKLERPLGKRNWIHLVLKSEKAIGKYSFMGA